jgi:uncharacterized membrane protein
MELKYEYLLFFHALAGSLGLLMGLAAALFRKGSANHNRVGRAFGGLMILAGASAVILALWHPNSFLLAIGFFTLYLVSSGWVWIRRTPLSRKVKTAKMVGSLGLVAALYMIYIGYTTGRGAIVLYIFAGILSVFALSDLFKKASPVKAASNHGGRMGGALIAAITAFLATNATFLPELVIWLGPTIIGSPLIAIGIRSYYKRNDRSVNKKPLS